MHTHDYEQFIEDIEQGSGVYPEYRKSSLGRRATLFRAGSSGAKASLFPLRMQRGKRGKTGRLQSPGY
jgi:hypothetical protein